MKYFTKDKVTARQGEVYSYRITELPKDAKPIKAQNGLFILGHSETGHHHVVKEADNVRYYSSESPLHSYLEVIEATEATETLLEHLRGHDTHETINYSAGFYLIVNGRESAPEGWRKAQD